MQPPPPLLCLPPPHPFVLVGPGRQIINALCVCMYVLCMYVHTHTHTHRAGTISYLYIYGWMHKRGHGGYILLYTEADDTLGSKERSSQLFK